MEDAIIDTKTDTPVEREANTLFKGDEEEIKIHLIVDKTEARKP